MKSCNGFYLVGQYPDPQLFKQALLEGLNYFDFAEIGIPFSDPVADGPVISTAAANVIAKGFSWNKLLRAVKEVRLQAPSEKKIYWMTYANILYYHGWDDFLSRSREAGIDGIIVPDIPFSQSLDLKKRCHHYSMVYIHFVTPENTEEQIKKIASAAEGFLYFVSIRGVTGSKLSVDEETAHKIQVAKKYSPVPVVLGFGIKDAESAGRALELADGFIAGTALVEALQTSDINGFRQLCKQLVV